MRIVRKLLHYLCIFVMLITFSCQDDTFIETPQEEILQSKNTFKSSTLYKEDLENNVKLNAKMNSLSTFKNQQIGKNVYNEIYDFTIETDIAKFVENIEDNTHSYTFAVNRMTNLESTIENIVFSYNVTNDTYEASLVSYLFSTSQKQEYLQNGYVTTAYDIQYESVAIDSNDILHKNSLPCTVTYQEFHIPYGSSNSHLYSTNGHIQNQCEHENDDDNPCNTYTVIDIYCPDGGSSSTGNATDDNSSSNNNTTNTNGGNSNTGNSGDSGGDDTTDNIITSIISREENVKQSILECINGLAQFNTVDSTTIDPDIFNQNDLTLNDLIEMLNYLEGNGCSEEAQEEIIEDLLEEFNDQIFKDENFTNNNCLNSVYTEMGKASKFNSYLKNFEPKFSVAHLRFSATTSMPDSINAVTSAPVNYLITITFNQNNLNRPKLAIARTFIHEIIHAEIYRKLLSVAQHPSIMLNQSQLTQLRNNYPGIYDYYLRWKWNVPQGQTPSSAQHEAMAQHYRGIIIQALREYDNTQTDEVYEALAWVGLENTVAWNNLSQSEKDNIYQTISTFYSNNPNCQ